MKANNLELIKQAGFSLRPHIPGVVDGIDWSCSPYGYDACIEKLVELVARRCVSQVAVVGLDYTLDATTRDQVEVVMECITSIKTYFDVV